jgi:chromosome segregation ATPase
VSTSFKRLGQSELLPRYIFAESLYARRRVLEIGAVASTLGQSARFLSTRGARVVVAADSDLEAIQEAQAKLAGPNLRFRPPVFDDFEAGSFDLVMVADLAPYVRAPELLKDLARLVAKSGYLMGGLRNPAGLALSNVIDPEEAEAQPTYGQLLDALSTHFASVEVATQSPVLGYQLAFERGEGLQVDGSLAGISEAAYFIVIAGQEAARSFEPTWVQLPPEPLAFTGGKLEDYSTRAKDWRERADRLKDALQKKTVELETRQVDLRETKEQLEATREAVARLTAQFESQREKPENLRDREELAQRVRRLEAELTVLRERAIDAEGRATAARNERDALDRAQKDAAIGALSAQEQIRLERARREEVATQLEDARTRLARAYEALKTAQEDAVAERLERERALSQADRLRETLGLKENELTAARQRELSLADARTQSLQAIEGLERSLGEARSQMQALRDEASHREADRLSLARSFEVESDSRRSLEKDVQRLSADVASSQQELVSQQATVTGLETELQAAASAHARALRDIETLSNSERTWRELSGQYEQRLAETNVNVQQLSDQIAQLSAEKDAELARGRRLERDLETALTTERSTREQAEVLSTDLRRQLTEVGEVRDRLIEERNDLRGAIEDLRKARLGEQARVDALETEKTGLQANTLRLEGELAAVRTEQAELARGSAQQQRTLEAALAERDTALATERATTGALRQQVVGMDAELARFGGMLRDGQRILGETRAALEGRTAEAEAERETASQLRERIGRLEATLARATEALEETSATLASTRTEKQSLQARFDETAARSNGLVEQVQNLQRITMAADEALAAARSQRNAFERELRDLREATEFERKQSAERLNALQQSATTSSSRASELEARLSEASRQLQQTAQAASVERERSASLQQTVASRDDALRTLDVELESVRTSLEAVRGERVALEAALRDSQDALARRTTSFNEVQGALATASDELTRRVALLVERDQQLAALTAERDGLALSGTEQQQRVGELSRRLAEQETRATGLEQALADARARHETAAADFQTKLQAAEAELTERRGTVESLAGTVASLEARLAEREIALAAVTTASTTSAEAVARLEAELSTERQQAQRLSAELQRLTAELEEGAIARREELQLRERADMELRRLTDELAQKASALSALETARLALDGLLAERTQLHDETLAARSRDLEEARQLLEARTAEWAQTRASLVDDQRRVLDARIAEWEQARTSLVDAHRRELDATTQAAMRALEARQAELEAQLRATREAHSATLEQQAKAYQQNLEQKSSEAARVLAAREDELLQRVATAEARGNDLDRQREAVKVELEQAREAAVRERAEAQSQLETVQTELASVQSIVDKATSEARGHQAGKQALQVELDRSRVELDQLRTSLAQAGGETRAMAEARAQVESEVERLRQRVPELEAELQQLRGTQPELSSLRERVPALEKSIAELTQRAELADEGKTALVTAAAASEVALVELRARSEALEASQAELVGRIAGLQEQVVDAEARAASIGEQLSQYQDERPALDTELTELRLRANVAERRLAEAERAAPTSNPEIEALRRRLPELEAELEIARVNARNDVDVSAAGRKQAEELLLALRVKYGDLQHELTVANEQLEQTRRGTPDLREEVAELRAENELIESERERLADAVDALEKRLKDQDQLKDRLLRLETDLTLTKKLLDQARGDLEAARTPTRRPAVPFDDFEDESQTAVTQIPDLAALRKASVPEDESPTGITAILDLEALKHASRPQPPPVPKQPPPPSSPPPPVPGAEPEVFELDVTDDESEAEAEEIVLFDEEVGENGSNGGKKK